MGLLALIALAAIAIGRLPIGRMAVMLGPVWILAAFTIAVNLPSGTDTGLFVAARMIVLVGASFVACLTTSSTDLVGAFRSLMAPLRSLKLPVDDIAFTLALAIRFIPQIAEELARIRTAQIARGGNATTFAGSLRVWSTAFSSLFIGLFRHAGTIALAMDARCYGSVSQRTTLRERPFSAASIGVLVVGLSVLVAIAVVF